MAEQMDFSDASFRENMNFLRTMFDQKFNENQSDSFSPWPSSITVDKNSNMVGSFNALYDMAHRETGMTPTSTDINAAYKSPKMEVDTPRANLYSRPYHSTPSARSPHSGDTSGISSGTDVSTDGSSPYRAITNKNWNNSSLIRNEDSPHSTSISQNSINSPIKSSPITTKSQISCSISSDINDALSPNAFNGSRLLHSQSQSSPLQPTTPSFRNLENRDAFNIDAHLSAQNSDLFGAGSVNMNDIDMTAVNANLLNDNLQQLLTLNGQPNDKQILSTILTLMNNNNNDYLGLGNNSTPNFLPNQNTEDIAQMYNKELLLRLLTTPSATPLLATNTPNLGLNAATNLSDPNLNSLLNLSGAMNATNASSLNSSLLDQYGQIPSTSPGNIFNTSGNSSSNEGPILSPSVLKQFGLLGGTESLSHNLPLSDDVQQMVQIYRNVMSPYLGEIEKAASLYRSSADCISQKNEVPYHWSGTLSNRVYNNAFFSRKVFLGGVPWDSSSEDLVAAFSRFGPVTVLWPQKEGYSATFRRTPPPKGYCYLLFDNENSVRLLLGSCTKDAYGSDYFKIASVKFRSKDVQVIPWVVNDSQFTKVASQKPDNKRTVFIGALHGMITAETLANIIDDLFGGVTFAAIDTDKYKYPIGSGRVSFSSTRSYVRAVTANFVDIRTPKFSKTIQIDPYLEDALCRNCFIQPGVYFCRSFDCFRYFCPACWKAWHSSASSLCNHKPLRRTFKPAMNPTMTI